MITKVSLVNILITSCNYNIFMVSFNIILEELSDQLDKRKKYK